MRISNVTETVEDLLEQGVSDREEILDVLVGQVDVDLATLKRKFADRRLSLSLLKIQDDDGERLAFPTRDSEGDKVIVHLDHNPDARLLLDIADRKERRAKRELHEARRLRDRAQLELNLEHPVAAD